MEESLIIKAKYKSDRRRWKLSNLKEIPEGIQRVSREEIIEITAATREKDRAAKKRKAEKN